MKTVYHILINRKSQIAKYVFFLILFGTYPIIYRTACHFLYNRYDYDSILYIGRLLFITLICILLVYVRFAFLNFVKRDWESLVLLGLNFLQRFILFSITHLEIFLLQVYFGMMIAQIQGMNIGLSIAVNVINAFLIDLLGIWISLHAHSKSLTFLAFAAIGLLGILVGTRKLSFKAVNTIVMSDIVTGLLFSDHVISIAVRVILSMCLLLFFSYRYRTICVGKIISKTRAARIRITGELYRLSRRWVHGKNYAWMYRSKDFILWKIFSTLLFIVFCLAGANNIVLFLLAYGICLISSLYLKDIYHFEAALWEPYYMSNYAYTCLLRDLILNGFFLLGDNVFLVVFLNCLFHPESIMILPVLALAVLFVTGFVINHLFAKYPAKQYYLSICVALIQSHLPILNLYFLYQNIEKGKKNWEEFHDENRPQAHHRSCHSAVR